MELHDRTYLSLGTPANWRFEGPFALVLIAVSLVLVPLNKKLGRPTNPGLWAPLGWGVCTIFAAVLGLPQTWGMAWMPLSYGIALLFPTKAYSPILRIVMIPIFIYLTWLIASTDTGRQRIVLGTTDGEYTQSGRTLPGTIYRNDLSIAGYRNTRTAKRGEYDWTVFRSNQEGMPGPDFRSGDLFWGPHGIVRGDQLANRIAKWAGVKPTYDNYSM